MAVLKCGNCASMVESNRCCLTPMAVQGEKLQCGECGKIVLVNRCCGSPMKEA